MDSAQAAADLTERLRREMEASASALQSAAKDSTVNSTQAIVGLTDHLRREVEFSATALRSAAKDSTVTSTQAIAGLTDRLRVEVEQSGALLREALERSASASVNALGGTGERLRNELTLVLDRLGDASETLERIVGSAGSDLNAVQTGLAERSSRNSSARWARFPRKFPGSTGRPPQRRPKQAPWSSVWPSILIRWRASLTTWPRPRNRSTRRSIGGAKPCRR